MISMSKKYQTRDGDPVTIFTTNANGEYPVMGIIHYDDCDAPESWTANGLNVADDEIHCCDLIEVPEVKQEWPSDAVWRKRFFDLRWQAVLTKREDKATSGSLVLADDDGWKLYVLCDDDITYYDFIDRQVSLDAGKTWHYVWEDIK